jgi:hypothetical protein
MPILCDAGCRNTVFAARGAVRLQQATGLLGAGLRRFRVELLAEPPEQVGPLLDRCRSAITRVGL